MGPASCGDPQCEADHGYSGTIAQEDIVLRISAEADGLAGRPGRQALRPRPAGREHGFHGSRSRTAASPCSPGPGRACSETASAADTSSAEMPAHGKRQPPPPPQLSRPHGPVTATLLPPAPAFGQRSIAEVLTSAAASLGRGRVRPTRWACRRRQRVCVVLADGLGRNLLKQKSAHTPFLRSVMQRGQGDVPVWLDSTFPSTTAAALASFGTGLAPGQHGMVGYDVLDPDQDKVVNMLGNWDAGVDPLTWQPFPTVFERAAESRRRDHRQPAAVRQLAHDPGGPPGRHVRLRHHLACPHGCRRRGHGRGRTVA